MQHGEGRDISKKTTTTDSEGTSTQNYGYAMLKPVLAQRDGHKSSRRNRPRGKERIGISSSSKYFNYGTVFNHVEYLTYFIIVFNL